MPSFGSWERLIPFLFVFLLATPLLPVQAQKLTNYVKGKVIVRFSDGATPTKVQNMRERLEATQTYKFKLIDAEVWKIPGTTSVQEFVRRHNSSSLFQYVQPAYKAVPLTFNQEPDLRWEERRLASFPQEISNTCDPEGRKPNDPMFCKQWPFYNSGTGDETIGNYPSVPDADIDAPEAWEISTGSGNQVTSAIIGFGGWRHEDLVPSLWSNSAEDVDGDRQVVVSDGSGGWEFDPDDENGVDDGNNGKIDDFIGWDFGGFSNDNDPSYGGIAHTFKVAGIAGASSNNGKGVSSTDWNARLMMVEGAGSSAAVDYAVSNGAKIINASWKTYSSNQNLRDVIEEAGDEENVLFVAAAGNDGCNNDNPDCAIYPASWDLDNIISVAGTGPEDSTSVTFRGELKFESNFGPASVDLAAPASAYETTGAGFAGGRYEYQSTGGGGTSWAAPQVVAAASLLWSEKPGLTVSEMKSLLMASVDPLRVLMGRTVSNGRLNVRNAMRLLKDLVPQNTTLENQTLSTPESYFALDELTANDLLLNAPRNGIKLVAGQRVRLGAGFKVEKGTPMVVEVRPELTQWREGTTVASKENTRSNKEPDASDEASPSKSVQDVPDTFALGSVYPNPIRLQQAAIPMALPERAHVHVSLYDVLGRRVDVLADRDFTAGRPEITFDPGSLSSGAYLVRVKIEPLSERAIHTFSRKISILK